MIEHMMETRIKHVRCKNHWLEGIGREEKVKVDGNGRKQIKVER